MGPRGGDPPHGVGVEAGGRRPHRPRSAIGYDRSASIHAVFAHSRIIARRGAQRALAAFLARSRRWRFVIVRLLSVGIGETILQPRHRLHQHPPAVRAPLHRPATLGLDGPRGAAAGHRGPAAHGVHPELRVCHGGIEVEGELLHRRPPITPAPRPPRALAAGGAGPRPGRTPPRGPRRPRGSRVRAPPK